MIGLLPPVPAGFFGMVLGLAALGGAWRVAARVWGVPAIAGEALIGAAVAIWLAWCLLYAAKWTWRRPAARAELDDPVQSFALGMLPMSTLVISAALAPHVPWLTWWLMVLGIGGGLALTVRLVGVAWRGGRGLETVTPLIVLAPVGTPLTAAMAAAAHGHPQLAALLWGPGVVMWVVLDSLILLRLVQHGLPLPLRATIGIQLAPPAVACLSYLAFASGPPDLAVHVLIGHALLQGCILLGLAGWIREQPFSSGAWAFTFGIGALSTATLLVLEREPSGAIGLLAWPVFLIANAVIGWIAVRTAMLALSGRLFPTPAAQQRPA